MSHIHQTADAMAVGRPLTGAGVLCTNLVGPTSRDHGRGAATASPRGKNAPEGPKSAPPDLMAFLAASTLSGAVDALRLSRPQISRLRSGYWPTDARKIVSAWDRYKGRTTERQSGWFLRRVQPDGTVLHAGQAWAAPGLALRTGQTLAVARSAADALVAQTLDLPSERFALQRLEG